MTQFASPELAGNMMSVLMKSKVALNPYNLIYGRLLKIKVKETGAIIPLVPSYAQLRILHLVEMLEAMGWPVRMHILKARQLYASTITEAILYSKASQTVGVNGMVIADDDDGSTYLYEMQRLMQVELEREYPFMVDPLKKNSEQKLEWQRKNSWMMTDTANNLKAGRKYTLHYVHVSESAFFRDYNKLTTGLFQSVPDLAGTMIFNESTANGMAGGFYDAVMSCYTPNGKWNEKLGAWVGPDGWVLLFIAWYEHPEYALPLEGGVLEGLDGIHFETSKLRDEFLHGEESLKLVLRSHARKIGVPTEKMEQRVMEQLNWRRKKIKRSCKGSVATFNQEYPESVDVAFLTSGRPVFSTAIITSNLRMARFTPPKFVGNLEWDNVYVDHHGNKLKGPYVVNDVCLNASDLKVKFVDHENGRWRVWRKPEDGWENRYCIPGDTAEGLTHGNYSTGIVLDRKLQRDGMLDFIQAVATINLHLDVDEYAYELVKAALWYNNAVVGIERNNHGLAVIKRAWQVYKRMFYRAEYSHGWPESSDLVGWQTTPATRPIAIADAKEWIDKTMLRVPDIEFWKQARTFVENEKGKAAGQGKHGKTDGVKSEDDFILTAAIGVQMHLWLPAPSKVVAPVTGFRKRLQENKQSGGVMSV